MLCGASSNLKLHSLAKIAVFGCAIGDLVQSRAGPVGSGNTGAAARVPGVWGLATLSSPYPHEQPLACELRQKLARTTVLPDLAKKLLKNKTILSQRCDFD